MATGSWSVKSVHKLTGKEGEAELTLTTQSAWTAIELAELFEHFAREARAGTLDEKGTFAKVDTKMAGGAFSLEEIEQAKLMIEEK